MGKDEKIIIEWQREVNKGLVNGLSHTAMDGRKEKIEFWRKRSMLFNAFNLCVQRLTSNQSYNSEEKELQEIAEEGYSLKGD